LHDDIHMNNVGSAAVGAIIACQFSKTLAKTDRDININLLFSGDAPFALENCAVEKESNTDSKHH
jgi:hypothetical protein